MGVKQFGIRGDILGKITSPEADRVTGNLSTLYLRLLRAPGDLWESEGVLRLVGEMRDEGPMSAWERLLEIVQVAPGTARGFVRRPYDLHGGGIICTDFSRFYRVFRLIFFRDS